MNTINRSIKSFCKQLLTFRQHDLPTNHRWQQRYRQIRIFLSSLILRSIVTHTSILNVCSHASKSRLSHTYFHAHTSDSPLQLCVSLFTKPRGLKCYRRVSITRCEFQLEIRIPEMHSEFLVLYDQVQMDITTAVDTHCYLQANADCIM